MNPVFWLLVILALVILWFILSFLFKRIGNLAVKTASHIKKEMLEDESEVSKEKINKNERKIE